MAEGIKFFFHERFSLFMVSSGSGLSLRLGILTYYRKQQYYILYVDMSSQHDFTPTTCSKHFNGLDNVWSQ